RRLHLPDGGLHGGAAPFFPKGHQRAVVVAGKEIVLHRILPVSASPAQGRPGGHCPGSAEPRITSPASTSPAAEGTKAVEPAARFLGAPGRAAPPAGAAAWAASSGLGCKGASRE